MDVDQVAEIREALTPKEEVVTEPETLEAEAKPDEVEEGEVAAEGEVDAEAEVVEPEGDANASYTVKSFAEAVGWEAEDIYNDLTIPMDNGENIPLGEFKNNYQNLVRDHEATKTQLQQAQQGVESARNGATQQQQMSQEMMQVAGALQSLDKLEKDTNWQEIEDLDPTSALLQRGKIDRERAQLHQQGRQIQAKQNQEQETFKQEARDKMLELVPEWKDVAVYNKDYAEIRSVMQTHGFGYSDIDNIQDPRQLALLKQLVGLVSKQKVASEAANKVRQAPKTLKGRKPEIVKKNTISDKLIAQAGKTHSKKDEHAAIKSVLMQSQ